MGNNCSCYNIKDEKGEYQPDKFNKDIKSLKEMERVNKSDFEFNNINISVNCSEELIFHNSSKPNHLNENISHKTSNSNENLNQIFKHNERNDIFSPKAKVNKTTDDCNTNIKENLSDEEEM